MKKVGIAGYGITKFTQEDYPIESLLLKSVKNLFDTTPNLHQNDIDTLLISTNDNAKYLAPIVGEFSGIQPRNAHTIENLCNSGSSALVSAFSYIASGISKVALVVGGERANSPGKILEWDISRGNFQHPMFWASLFTKAHKRKFKTTEEDLAFVAAKNHRNSINNPYAYSHKNFSFEEILNAKFLTDDLKISDCSKLCSGSAAILLASEDVIKKFTNSPIWISSLGQKTSSASFSKNNLNHLESTKIAANQAFSNSKIQPKEIDVAEIHDAFTVCELIALEDLQLVNENQASNFVRELYNTNDRKINPRGGLIGSGHPLGATGIAQTIEVFQQLSDMAEKRQVPKAEKGLVHNMSAAGTSSTVILLTK